MSEQSNEDALRLARELADAYRGQARKVTPKKKQAPPPRIESRRDLREDAVPINGVLNDLISEQGWGKALAGTRVFSDWPLIVGDQVAQHTKVEHFADGVVYVLADSTAWAKELTLLAPRIVARLNEHLGDGEVQRIEVKGPQAPSWKSGPRSVKGRGPRDTYG